MSTQNKKNKTSSTNIHLLLEKLINLTSNKEIKWYPNGWSLHASYKGLNYYLQYSKPLGKEFSSHSDTQWTYYRNSKMTFSSFIISHGNHIESLHGPHEHGVSNLLSIILRDYETKPINIEIQKFFLTKCQPIEPDITLYPLLNELLVSALMHSHSLVDCATQLLKGNLVSLTD